MGENAALQRPPINSTEYGTGNITNQAKLIPLDAL